MTYKSVGKTQEIVSDNHDQGKDTVALFIDFLCNHFDDADAVVT